jgi:uncharacterized membrane protein (UPF0127 family)
VSPFSIARRSLLTLAMAFALAPAAQALDLPRQDPAHCQGQPEIKPLQPLAIESSGKTYRFMVEFADNDRTRSYGLMCRKVLAPDRGMLFDFKQPQDAAFWMRNTLIPLDIVYIRADGHILSIARNARPLDENPIPAGGVIRGVLELPGGRAAQLGLLPGDRVKHRIFPGG